MGFPRDESLGRVQGGALSFLLRKRRPRQVSSSKRAGWGTTGGLHGLNQCFLIESLLMGGIFYDYGKRCGEGLS